MSVTRDIRGGGQSIAPNPDRERDKEVAFSKADRSERPELARESFISQMVAKRQPPPLSLSDILTPSVDAVAPAFSAEIEALNARDPAEVAGDLAEIYLIYQKRGGLEVGTALDEAFDQLGELLRSYEHIRLLRTGELG